MRLRWFSIATAHSAPASAASNACVERTRLAALRCSKTRLRLAYAAISVIANSSITLTSSVAAPRCLDRSVRIVASGGAGADERVVAQPNGGAHRANHA